MTDPHPHHLPLHAGVGPTGWITAVAALVAAVAYVLASTRLRHRGDTWPACRDTSFVGGCGAVAVLGPLPGGSFTAHMAHHLVLAMVAPVLVVCARPLTLVLRALPPGRARRTLLSVAHSKAATVLTFPPLVTLFDIGGLWLLYRTGLFATTHHQPLVHAAVHFHVLAAGLLFTFTVCQLDPVRHRWSLAWRGSALVAAGAAHAVLAKALYATPPPHTTFTPADVQTGAQLMYYGGDAVEVALAVVIAIQWYTATGRARARAQRREPASWINSTTPVP